MTLPRHCSGVSGCRVGGGVLHANLKCGLDAQDTVISIAGGKCRGGRGPAARTGFISDPEKRRELRVSSFTVYFKTNLNEDD